MKISSKIFTVLGGLLLSVSFLTAQLGPEPSPSDVEAAVSEQLPRDISISNAQPNQLAMAANRIWSCENVVAVVDALTAANPRAAIAITLAAARRCPELAPQIAGVAATNAPEYATGIARAAASHNPRRAEEIIAAIVAAAPGSNASDVYNTGIEAARRALAGVEVAVPALDELIFDPDANNPSPIGL